MTKRNHTVFSHIPHVISSHAYSIVQILFSHSHISASQYTDGDQLNELSTLQNVILQVLDSFLFMTRVAPDLSYLALLNHTSLLLPHSSKEPASLHSFAVQTVSQLQYGSKLLNAPLLKPLTPQYA